MGKRELLIILAFVLVGGGIYQLTVVHRDTDRPFSFATALENLRPGARRDRATATVSRSGRIPAPPGVTEIRVAGLTTVVLVGEDRPDVAYEVAIEANGRDVDAARKIAQSTDVITDQAGSALGLNVRSLQPGRWSSTGTLRVPRAWLVTIEGSNKADVADLGGVYLHRMTGEAHLRGIRGEVTGSYRNGKLSVVDADRIDLLLVQSQAEVAKVRDSVRLGFRGGSAKLSSISGTATIEGDDYEVSIVEPAAPLRLSGAHAKVRIDRPRASVRADMRWSKVFVELDRALPLAITTTEERLEVQLDDDSLPITINARTIDGGTIDASTLHLSPETHERDSTLTHHVEGGAEIVLRNQRDVIVIAKRK